MLKRKGPILTLAVGVLLAAVILLLDVNATRDRDAKRAAASAATRSAPATPTAAAPTTAAPTTPPPTTAPPSPGPQVTYAGSAGNGSIAIAVRDGHAVAYLCDGRTAEAWLQGTLSDGTITMTGAHGAQLTGTVANGTATGTVTAVGRQWTFTAPTVTAPSGLYRAAAQVRGAQVVGGWIVLASGAQVGMIDFGDHEESAPPLQGTTANLGGTTATANRLDGSGL
jgi:serine/threonine-protein kinase